MLQVTLNTSLKLRGRTTEFPRSDFNRQVIRFTRHTTQFTPDDKHRHDSSHSVAKISLTYKTEILIAHP